MGGGGEGEGGGSGGLGGGLGAGGGGGGGDGGGDGGAVSLANPASTVLTACELVGVAVLSIIWQLPLTPVQGWVALHGVRGGKEGRRGSGLVLECLPLGGTAALSGCGLAAQVQADTHTYP